MPEINENQGMTKIKQPNGQLEKVTKTVGPDLHREKTRKPLFQNF